MNRFLEDLIDDLNKGPIPEVVFVIAHLVGGIIFIQYIYQKRKQNPIIQNSPYLTIFAQIFLFFSTLCLLASKILISNQISYFNYTQQGCLLKKQQQGNLEYNLMIGISLTYIFSLEFVFNSYFLKMIRVLLTVVHTQTFNWIFKREWALIFISTTWACIITLWDLFFKFYKQGDYPLLYPQLVTFMCDGQQYVPNGVQYFWYTRQFVLLIPFLWSFWYSYRLEQIDEDLKLRKQYFVLLSLPLISMIVSKMIKITGSHMNISLLIHYIDCIINLCTCLLLFLIHFRTPKNRDLYLPDQRDLIGQSKDLSFLFYTQQSSEILAKYFQYKQKQNLFNIRKMLFDQKYDHTVPTKQKVQQLLSVIEEENLKKQVRENIDVFIKFTKAKNIIDNQVNQIVKEWQQTISYQTLMRKWEKSGECYTKMRKLQLVVPITNATSSISSNSSLKQTEEVLLPK